MYVTSCTDTKWAFVHFPFTHFPFVLHPFQDPELHAELLAYLKIDLCTINVKESLAMLA